MPPPPELRAGGLALRPWRLEDVPRVTEICQDPEIARWTRIPSPYTEEHARTWIEQTSREWDEHTQATFAVTDAESDEVLGAIALHVRRDGFGLQASIGYWVAAEARGRGVATAALRLISGWGLRELDLPRVQLVTDPENDASQRVAEKAGFQREGILRRYLEDAHGRRDCVMFSLLAEELETRDRG
jgi:RimJ/RimL family protein N-acetyltransferase